MVSSEAGRTQSARAFQPILKNPHLFECDQATAHHAIQRQQEAVKLGCFLDTSFRRSRSKSLPSSERPLISFCASIACCLRDSVASCLVEASACRCPARLPAHVKK